MHLQSLSLRNFRNYQSLDLHFEPSGSLFLGGNAQGKTNLIEAINYIATARSQRGALDRDLLRRGAEFFIVKGQGSGGKHWPITIEIRFLRENNRQLKINGAIHRKVSNLSGLLSVLDFSPEDVNIVAGSPHHRRRFLNFCLCQISSSYWVSLTEYGRVLQQRNTALKTRSSRRWHVADDDELEAWNRQLIKLGAHIIQHRSEFVGQLNPQVNHFHRQITGGDESIVLTYEPAIDSSQEGQIPDQFRITLQRARDREIQLGMTLVGPHRDDVNITVNGLQIRSFGSQGQQRTAAIALKLAAARRLEQARGEQPILLLDDVFAELDVERTRMLFDLFKQFGQLFIATAKESDLAGCGQHLQRMSISNGMVKPYKVG